MAIKWLRRLVALCVGVALAFCACASPDSSENRDALTWTTWNGCQKFLALLNETYPDISLDFISYTGGNRTGYSWIQMQNNDISDIFLTSQILDKELAQERLADLSGCDFVSRLPTSVLDQVAIDGGIYLLPVNYAMYGIFYNKTLMEEHNWSLPQDFAQLEALCKEIREEGLIPGIIGTQLTGNPFSAVFNLAKTSWLTTPDGVSWERDFLAGRATAQGMWEGTMDYVQKYMDIGMFTPDPEDRNNPTLILDYLGNRKAVFCTTACTVNITELPDTGDKLGIMPYIGEDGSKNIYMYSPSIYFGIRKELAEPGNEEKLEKALRILSLLFSPEGQATFISEETPCVMSVLSASDLTEESFLYDAWQAMEQGRAFPMTYAGWETILSDTGQAYKDWFRGENAMDGPKCIARMDELQKNAILQPEQLFFGESTADFTLEETGRLIGKALGSAVGADAVMVPFGGFHDGTEIHAGLTGKLYQGKINMDVVATICPGLDGEYALMSMTGAQAKALAQAGFDPSGDGNPFPYLLVTRGDRELEDNTVYQIAFLMQGYTAETGEAYAAQVQNGSLKEILWTYFTEQKTVSPQGNPWE